MRTCSRCKTSRPIENFREKKINKKGETIYQAFCKECNKEYQKWHYQQNMGVYKSRNKQRKVYNRDINIVKLLEYFSDHPCIDCGEADPIVLEFDHRSTKSRDVSRMIPGFLWVNILLEIEKCDVRCSNCHKRKTAKQFGWTMLQHLSPLTQTG